mmetsp:Transcript_4085/g.8396  ORF Transcript_4085/g.8396 Transcript_4085/m.8396 type:complete len:537 (+) Transcript_4085:101-1711(+)
MTLTTVVGSSGSGKTTFLNSVYQDHKCIYIRQYHSMRPYIPVSKIPNFDATQLPYWDTYVKEETANTILVGGTMAGNFHAGLSGGQRKLLLFELVCQRTASQKDLLITLDEPFAGVTDDFVPFIVDRLNQMSEKHNVVLVTNDHVQTLTSMANNIITVSAVDRSVVQINDLPQPVDRRKAIMALKLGTNYRYEQGGKEKNAGNKNLHFFMDVEVYSNTVFKTTAYYFLALSFLFVGTFWNSDADHGELILLACVNLTYYHVMPLLVSLTEWRASMTEEAEALMHSSVHVNKMLKTAIIMGFITLIAVAQYAVLNICVTGFSEVKFALAIVSETAFMTFPFIYVGLFTKMESSMAHLVGSMPIVFTIFFSTTYSPGAGVPVIKDLRYLFSRFYFWCMIPSIQDSMEGCPNNPYNTILVFVSSMFFLFIFLAVMGIRMLKKKQIRHDLDLIRSNLKDSTYKDLQIEMYGPKVLRRLSRSTKRHEESVLASMGAFDVDDSDDDSTDIETGMLTERTVPLTTRNSLSVSFHPTNNDTAKK